MPSIPAIGQITDPKKTRVALVQGQQIISAPATALSDAVGLPAGGSTGQVLTKSSGTDYDTAWANTGNFSGPASATDGNLVAFDGTTGKLGKDSGKKPADFATAAQGAKADTAVQPSGVRELLTANRTYYVATTGSDSNNGLASAAAFLTLQKAIDTAAALDSSIYNVTIQLAAGTYSLTFATCKTMVGAGQITISGDTTTPDNVVLACTGAYGFYASGVQTLYVLQGMKLTSTGTNPRAIYTEAGSRINFKNINFGSGWLSHLDARSYSTINAVGPWTISAAASSASWLVQQATLTFSGQTVTLTGTPAFPTYFALAQVVGIINCFGMTFVGSATGTRYAATLNSVISTAGGGATYLPGSVNGSTNTGGQYV